jgi:hypothetical protein
MKSFIGIICISLAFVFIGCEKHVTPSKIKRKITKGTWRIAELVENDTNRTVFYSGLKFTFDQEGKLAVKGDTTLNGTWKLGTEKNPTLFFISLPLSEKTNFFVDDWLVYGVSRTELYMTRNDDAKAGEFVRFRLIE